MGFNIIITNSNNQPIGEPMIRDNDLEVSFVHCPHCKYGYLFTRDVHSSFECSQQPECNFKITSDDYWKLYDSN